MRSNKRENRDGNINFFFKLRSLLMRNNLLKSHKTRVGQCWPKGEHVTKVEPTEIAFEKMNWYRGSHKISFHLSWQKSINLDLQEPTFAENEVKLGKSHVGVCLRTVYVPCHWILMTQEVQCYSVHLSDEPRPLSLSLCPRTHNHQRDE